jgi:hypothetical protein
VSAVEREDAGDGWTRLLVTPAADADPREALHAVVAQRGWPLREMRRLAPTLEELYVQITAGDPSAHAAGAPAAGKSAA